MPAEKTPGPGSEEPIVPARSTNQESPLSLPIQQGVGPIPTIGMIEAELISTIRNGEQLLPYLNRHMENVRRNTDPNFPSHPDKLIERGQGYQNTRINLGLERDNVARRMNIDPVQLMAFEAGLIPPDDLPEGFIQQLNSILGITPFNLPD